MPRGAVVQCGRRRGVYEGIEAAAFDIDGTLYPVWKLYAHLAPRFLRNARAYICYARTRRVMHAAPDAPDFCARQAAVFARLYGCAAGEAEALIDRLCYSGIARYFRAVRPYPGAVECVRAMKAAGLRIGVLSDFPPGQKGDMWGIRALCDACLGTEELGALKPSRRAFDALSRALGCAPGRILYVGNSVKYDIAGAREAGMKTALIVTGPRRLLGEPRAGAGGADIVFTSYRRLRRIVLG